MAISQGRKAEVLKLGRSVTVPVANIKTVKKCAFCKYWYDPTNSAIAPVAPNINMWGVATDMYNDRKKCIKTNLPKSAVDSCSRFECKLPVI